MEAAATEASRKQKVRNLQLKTVTLENEEYIQDLHITDHNQNQKVKLDAAHNKAFGLINSTEVGTKWNLLQLYDLPRLLKTCNLVLDPKLLSSPSAQPQVLDIVALRKAFEELRKHPNKNKLTSFHDLLEMSIKMLDEIEQLLRRSQVDATELAIIPVQATKLLEDIISTPGVTQNLTSLDENVEAQLAKIERANELQNVALADGEVAVAEDQYFTKIELMESLLDMLYNKAGIIDTTRKAIDYFKTHERVGHKTKQLAEDFRREKNAFGHQLQDDLRKVTNALATAELDDAEALKAHTDMRLHYEDIIQENHQHQEQCWAEIQKLELQLQRLGTQRFETVKRILEDVDKEERRRVDYAQFVEVAVEHKKLLEITIHNNDVALETLQCMQTIAESCIDGVKERYEAALSQINTFGNDVNKELLEAFRQLYMTLGQLKYKKERKLEDIDQSIREAHIQLEFCIDTFDPNAKKHSDDKKELYNYRAQTEEELELVNGRMESTLTRFIPIAKALDEAGVHFIHPVQELEETNLHRQAKMVDFQLTLQGNEERRIIQEREAIKSAYQHREARAITAGTSPVKSPTATTPALAINSPQPPGGKTTPNPRQWTKSP